jgi:hypothetical protein
MPRPPSRGCLATLALAPLFLCLFHAMTYRGIRTGIIPKTQLVINNPTRHSSYHLDCKRPSAFSRMLSDSEVRYSLAKQSKRRSDLIRRHIYRIFLI